jgi:hydrogenase/urease accessory protein HupE
VIFLAHLVTTGLGPFYDGLGHLVLTPEDLLPVIGLGLLAGLKGPPAGRRALLLLPGAWLLTGLLGLGFPGLELPGQVTVASFLVFGGLVAADAPLPTRAVAVLALLLGGMHGFLNGAAMAAADLGWVGLLGIVAGVAVLVPLVSALAVAARSSWSRIAVRVAGSWLLAVGILMLGWSFRGAG